MSATSRSFKVEYSLGQELETQSQTASGQTSTLQGEPPGEEDLDCGGDGAGPSSGS